MKAKEIKEYIYKEKKVPIVLEKLSMHNILTNVIRLIRSLTPFSSSISLVYDDE